MTRHVYLFDLDGTMVLSDDIYIKVWSKLLKEYNIFVDKDFFNKNIQGQTDNVVLQRLLKNKNIDFNFVSKLKDTYFIEFIKDIIIVDGIIEYLKYLKENNQKVGIVTNCNSKCANYIIDYCGFREYIDHLVIGSECKKPKPYPDPYIEAMEYFKVNNNEVIIFEDSKSGLLRGKSANPLLLVGITTVFDKNELEKLHVGCVIDNYMGLKNKNILSYIQSEDTHKYLKKLIHTNFKEKIKHIEIYDNKLKGGYISDVLRVQIMFDSKTIDCVMKIENKIVNNLSIMANKLGLYEREYYFYEALGHYVPVKIPHFHGLLKDEQLNNRGILLENLNQDNFCLNLNLNEENIDISLKIIDEITKLHLKFWNKNIINLFPGLKKNNDQLFQPCWELFVKEKWSMFLNKWEFLLNEKQIEIGSYIVEHFHEIQENLSKDNLTLIHGDVKSPNLFYKKTEDDNYEPYFIDWQYICNGKGVQDLVFFMIESFDIEKLKIIKDLFLNYYFIKIQKEIKEYDYETFIQDVKDSSSYYPFFVAVWFGSTPEEDLIDKNFPFFFIQKVFTFLEMIY